jgi:protein phosphatase-4 regulatory subunit 3
VEDLSIQEVALYAHLLEVLCFFIRQHNFRSKYFILSEGLAARVAQLMDCPEKHLQLTALKYFRIVIGFHDETHNRQIIQHQLFEPILRILFDTMPRDNLLNSACLELFEFIKRENIKMLVQHLVETYREKLEAITYVDTFQNLILRYDQMHEPVTTQELEHSFTSVDSDTPARHHAMVNGGKWGQGLKEVDADEEAYFNASDDEDELPGGSGKPGINGASPVRPLVNYPDDDADDDDMDILATDIPPSAQKLATITRASNESTSPKAEAVGSPPERISEKRRREEDEEDELLASISTSTGPKRRASTASNASTGSLRSLRRKSPNINSGKDGNGGPKKISLSLPLKSGGEGGEGE